MSSSDSVIFGRTQFAQDTPFDNSTNGFTADNVQAAIEEIDQNTTYNDKFNFHLASLSAYDKIVDVTYLDQGLRTERISTVVMASVLYPNTTMTKTIFWLDVGSMKQRIDRIQWAGPVLGTDIVQKVYEYLIANNKVSIDRYYYELI
jgi:hypothetical protein